MFSLILLTAFVPTADALSCLAGPGDVLPRDGARDVPVDAIPRIAMHYGQQEHVTIQLVEAGSDAVISTTQELVDNPGSTELLYLIPDASLSPETDYRIESLWEGETAPWVHATFTTGDAEMTATVEAPIVLDVSRDQGRSEWGSWRTINVDVDVDGAPPASYLVQVSESEDFSEVQEIEMLGGIHDEGERRLGVGSGECGGTISLESGRYHVRVASVNYQGERSDFVDAGSSLGCSAAAGGATLWGALLGFIGVCGLRRRRRR
ncbi:MAG: hypothetical protein AAFV53_03425 [Myxococcota bacterium]